MPWTPLFLKLDGKKVFILGSGEVATRRAIRFREAGAKVIICGDNIQPRLEEMGIIYKPLEKMEELIKWADIIITASGDPTLNEKVASLSSGKLLNRADKPQNGNLIVPITFSTDDVEIAISTHGKSPIMARAIRDKIKDAITEEDILQIRLQDYARRKLKKIIPDQKKRRRILYSLTKDNKIQLHLKNNDLEEAKKYVDSLIEHLGVS
ncbi:MAG: bifunctional precorrin-2 dehydrogenase/sirohydrochlorin ferrochelatase [Methanobacteriales archaeon]|nr:bifunctional precorrin-2 dehydrogenase/sirohydrochlorin ferrochelatase [Methanobacteriales archaeon]MBC7118176.1 bifunctional precorrin-2 dehydrogenase/sirohydrochlorin ferrochelatase [Methanobacteriaceae archaeon]